MSGMSRLAYSMRYFLFLCAAGILGTGHADAEVDKAERLAKSLLGFQYGRADSSNFELEFSYDMIPGQLSDLISLPENSQLHGSVMDGKKIDMVFVTETTLDAVETYYKKSMPPKWKAPDTGFPPMMVGFQTQPRRSYLIFCNADNSAYINIAGRQSGSAGKTYVRVTYNTSDEHSPCTVRAPRFVPPRPPAMAAMPQLINPEGIKASRGHTTGGGNGISTSIVLHSRDIDKMAQHYYTQLQGQGWHPIDKHTGKDVAWGIWKFKDKDQKHWMGTLLLNLGASNADAIQARLWIFNIDDFAGPGGRYSYSGG